MGMNFYRMRRHSNTQIETSSGEYWSEYYVTEIDEAYRSILGIEEPKRLVSDKHQLKLNLEVAA